MLYLPSEVFLAPRVTFDGRSSLIAPPDALTDCRLYYLRNNGRCVAPAAPSSLSAGAMQDARFCITYALSRNTAQRYCAETKIERYMTQEPTATKVASTPSFDTLPFAPFLQETIRTVGYTTPTPIQADAIPVILEGRDLIGLAQTGTGKTAAFVLPLLHKLSGGKKKGVQALILAPTRELAEQINDVIKTFSGRTGIRTVTVYGGVSHRNQISQLRTNVQIVVACPGRLMDHIRGNTIDLSGVDHLILDEADRMLDMGFMPDIKSIMAELPAERQTMLFSATMPEEIAQLTKSYLREPRTVRVKAEQPVALVTHSMLTLKQEEKSERLASWLRGNPNALAVVFTKMKHTAKRLGDRLTKDGVPAVALHGNLSQAQRQKALQGFRDGRFRALIATDIASRGIDVEGVTHVLNYDMPDTLEAYIHRTGRSGRASREGSAVSFVTRADRFMVRAIEKWINGPMIRLNSEEDADVTHSAASDDSETSQKNYRPQRPQRRSKDAPRRSQHRRDGDSQRRTARGSERSGDQPWRRERSEESFRERQPRARQGQRDQQRSLGGGRKPFKGQADIDPRANYVYREREPYFIDRGASEGANSRGKSRRPRIQGREPGREYGREYNRDQNRDAGRGEGRSDSRSERRNYGRSQGRSQERSQERSQGRTSERRSEGRTQGRSQSRGPGSRGGQGRQGYNRSPRP